MQARVRAQDKSCFHGRIQEGDKKKDAGQVKTKDNPIAGAEEDGAQPKKDAPSAEKKDPHTAIGIAEEATNAAARAAGRTDEDGARSEAFEYAFSQEDWPSVRASPTATSILARVAAVLQGRKNALSAQPPKRVPMRRASGRVSLESTMRSRTRQSVIRTRSGPRRRKRYVGGCEDCTPHAVHADRWFVSRRPSSRSCSNIRSTGGAHAALGIGLNVSRQRDARASTASSLPERPYVPSTEPECPARHTRESSHDQGESGRVDESTMQKVGMKTAVNAAPPGEPTTHMTGTSGSD